MVTTHLFGIKIRFSSFHYIFFNGNLFIDIKNDQKCTFYIAYLNEKRCMKSKRLHVLWRVLYACVCAYTYTFAHTSCI